MGSGLSAVTAEFAAAAAEGRAFNFAAEDIQAAMRGLAPAAQDVVRAFSDLMPQFSAIRNLVQQNLFEGVADSMRALSDDAIPAVGRGLASLATSFNSFFNELLGKLETFDFAGIFAGLKPVVDSLLDAFLSLFDAVEPFLKAAAPAAQALARSFAAATESLSGMVAAGERSGNLAKFLNEGVESLRQWGGLLRSVGDALFTLFEAGKASGNSFVQSLTKIIDKFDTWMESVEGQESLAEFFATGERVMHAMIPVLEGLRDAFKNIVTPEAIGRFEELATAVGEVLPVLGKLFEIVGDLRILNTMATLLEIVAQAIEPVLPAIEELATAIGHALSDSVIALAPSIAKMAEAIGRIAEAVAPLLPDLAELAVVIIEAFAPLIIQNIDNFAAAIEASIPLIELLIDGLTMWMHLMEPISALLTDVSEVVGVVFEAIGTAIEFAVEKIRDFVDMVLDIPLVGRALSAVGIDVSSLTDDVVELEGSFHGAFGGTKELAPALEETSFAALDLDDAARKLAGAYEALILKAAAAAQEAERNERGWRMAESSILGVVDPLDEAGKAFERIKKAAEEADTAADNLAETFSLLFDPAAKAASASRDYEQALDDLTVAVQGGTEAQTERESAWEKQVELNDLLAKSTEDLSDEEKLRIERLPGEIAAHQNLAQTYADQAQAIDTTTEAGRMMSEMGETLAKSIFAQADAMVAQGGSIDQSAVAMVGWRENAIQTAIAAGATREEAEALLATYNLTPDAIATVFIQSGMTDAQKNAAAYDGDLNGIADSIDTLINQPGISEAMKNALLYDADLDGIQDVVDTEIKVTDNATGLIEDVSIAGEQLDNKEITPAIGITDEATPIIDEATGKVIGFGELAPTTTIGATDNVTPTIDPLFGALETYDGNTYVADIDARDLVQPVLDPLTATLEVYNGSTYEAEIAARDLAQPVLDPLTATLEVYAGNTYESEIKTRDLATEVLTPVKSDLEIYDARIYESEITLLDHTKPVLDPVKGALDVYDQRIYEADIIAADGATPTIVTATTAGGVWNESTFTAALGVEDNATPKITDVGIIGEAFSGSVFTAALGVDGIEESKTGVQEVGGELDEVSGRTAEANVSIIGNTVVMIQLGIIGQALEILHAVRAKPQISLPDYARVVSQITTIATMLFSLNNQRATPTITIPTWFTAISQVGSLTQAIRNIPDKTVNVRAAVSGLSDVQALDRAINNLSSKTVTVTTRNVTIGQPANMTGAIVPGSAAGELIRGPTLRRVGERGYDEAIIPLQLPLNRVDPSVRDLAALLRGELVPAKAGPTKIINQYMTVNTVVQDPVAVATQVVNRSAMLAHN